MKIDKKNINFAVKSNKANYKEIDPNARTIKAIVNTYNFFDSDSDVLRPGCAKKTITERGANSQAYDKILFAKFHDLKELPGKSILEAETKINGFDVLYTEARLSETTEGEETLIQYKDGILNQHSIGFNYENIEYIDNASEKWNGFLSSIINPEDAEKQGFAYIVKEIKLFEWSAVAFGANKLTPFLGLKTANKFLQLENLYKKLDSLISKAKRFDKKDKYLFELNVKQTKQMIYELTTKDTFKKDIHTEPSKFEKSENKRNILINLI